MTPLYFTLDWIGRQYPPPITHPDFYFGFIGLALVWQAAFFVIAADPVRFRPMIAVAILEKFSYVITVVALYTRGRLQSGQVAPAVPDFILGILFIAGFLRTKPTLAQ